MPQNRIKEYLSLIEEALDGTEAEIEKASTTLLEAHRFDRRLWILGNGGSLAIAQHFTQDLIKMCGIRAHTINCPSVITAYSNDEDFNYSFFSPLLVLRQLEDPILIFSCSGKSRNYIEFISTETKPIISVVGTEGGFLREKSDICIHIKSQDYQVCETAFCVVADLLVKSLQGAIK